MKRHDRFWLTDILDAANLVSQFVGGHSMESFQDDVLNRSAVLHQLTVIGEAARHISIDVRERNPDLDWKSIVGFRNRIVHEFFGLDWAIV